jgi:hypothetical protein
MRNIFVIGVEDVQYLAKEKLGRKLTIEELELVKKGVELGLECWEDVVIDGIEELEDIVITKRLGT